jgi:hypothetical protein
MLGSPTSSSNALEKQNNGKTLKTMSSTFVPARYVKS